MCPMCAASASTSESIAWSGSWNRSSISVDRRIKVSSDSKYATAFGIALDEAMSKRGIRQTKVAEALGVSRAYVSNTMTGRYGVSGEQVDRFADALQAELDERAKLHRAAALDAGFKIDLTKEGDHGKDQDKTD